MMKRWRWRWLSLTDWLTRWLDDSNVLVQEHYLAVVEDKTAEDECLLNNLIVDISIQSESERRQRQIIASQCHFARILLLLHTSESSPEQKKSWHSRNCFPLLVKTFCIILPIIIIVAVVVITIIIIDYHTHTHTTVRPGRRSLLLFTLHCAQNDCWKCFFKFPNFLAESWLSVFLFLLSDF